MPEVVGQVLGRNALETEHPALPAIVIGVDILDVIGLNLALFLGVGRNAAKFDDRTLAKAAVSAGVVGTQHGIGWKSRN